MRRHPPPTRVAPVPPETTAATHLPHPPPTRVAQGLAPPVRLVARPTPLQRLVRLEAVVGGAPLWVKRDDLTGFGTAGNKARALEALLGQAVAERADVLVTGGARSSNFIAAAALGARVAGLACELVVVGDAADAGTRTCRLRLRTARS